MHPAIKLFCILWLFMGALLTTIGITQALFPFMLIGLLLGGLSISGILGFRAAPLALTLFWLSIFVAWVVMFLMNKAGPLSRVWLPCLAAGGFAFIAFMCGEDPPEEVETEALKEDSIEQRESEGDDPK